MEETLLRTLLFDFYGELLTDKQREYYDLHYNSDLSLFEIAEMSGTSRQAVWDIIRRSEQTLRGIEQKTGLVAKALKQRRSLEELSALAAELPESDRKPELLNKLKEVVDNGI